MDFESLVRPQPGEPPRVPGRLEFGIAPTLDDTDNDDWRRVADISDAAREVVAAFDQAVKVADADGDLSEVGKAKRRAAMAAEHEKVLARQERMIADAAKALEAEAAAIKGTLDKAGRDDQLEAMLALEYRNVLRAMPHAEREAEVLSAISARDKIKLAAIVGGMPQASGLAAAEGGVYSMARNALVAAVHGDGALDRLDRYAGTLAAARQAVQTARSYLKARIGDTGAQ